VNVRYCTYFDRNYLPRGLVMIDSLLAHDPDADITVLLITRLKLAAISVNSALRIKRHVPPVWQCLFGGAILVYTLLLHIRKLTTVRSAQNEEVEDALTGGNGYHTDRTYQSMRTQLRQLHALLWLFAVNGIVPSPEFVGRIGEYIFNPGRLYSFPNADGDGDSAVLFSTRALSLNPYWKWKELTSLWPKNKRCVVQGIADV
jgi:hypothetical protein